MQHKKILFISISSILFILFIIILITINKKEVANIKLFIIPTDSQILINGQKYQNGNYQLPIGETNISISKDGFKSKTFTINPEAAETISVYQLLDCEDGSLFCYLDENNKTNFNLLPYLINYTDNPANTALFYKKASIVDILPIDYTSNSDDFSIFNSFTVQLGNTTNQTIELIVTNFSNQDCKKIVEDIIQKSGYNINDYKIISKNTPFADIKMKENQ